MNFLIIFIINNIIVIIFIIISNLIVLTKLFSRCSRCPTWTYLLLSLEVKPMHVKLFNQLGITKNLTKSETICGTLQSS